MTDDETGEPLAQRKDDTQEALPTRLKAYHEETEPILSHYAKDSGCSVKQVNAHQAPDEVWREMARILGLRAAPRTGGLACCF
mmetsp:Transcript_89558/g.253836  ORF Transcript_89558/g.253836 Transcript_89558/m.253836 type:complete len:83 (+) Transcript_89558:410-658(+)